MHSDSELLPRRWQRHVAAKHREWLDKRRTVRAGLPVPSGPNELSAVLADHDKLKGYFSAEAVAFGVTRDFLDAYAKLRPGPGKE